MTDNYVKMYFDFEEIKKDVVGCVSHLCRDDYDFILAVAKGGLVPSAIIGNILNIPVMSVLYSSKNGRGTSLHPQQEDFSFNTHISHRILLVEDICDTGNTMSDLSRVLKEMGNDVTSFSYCHRPNDIFNPDLYCVEVPKSVDWVHFPWEPEE